MDFKKLITRYRQFGGLRLIWEYVKLGALWPMEKACLKCMVKGQSLKGIYPAVLCKIEPFLVKRYGTQILQISQRVKNDNLNDNNASTSSATIWWCWLQGFDAAPPIVKACYNSLVHSELLVAEGYKVKVIDNKNWREYVELPGYIVEKWEKGRLPAAMFSDLLRVELLIKYGGTWVDSTVLCSGGSCFMVNGSRFLDAELFLFQYTKQGSVPVSISNWFISAWRNNEVLRVLREMLYSYWKDYDCVLDYYIFHLFFAMISKEYPEQILAMPYAQSQNSIALMYNWGKPFNEEIWNNLTAKVCFHKLSHRVDDSVKCDKDNYYNAIIRMYG